MKDMIGGGDESLISAGSGWTLIVGTFAILLIAVCVVSHRGCDVVDKSPEATSPPNVSQKAPRNDMEVGQVWVRFFEDPFVPHGIYIHIKDIKEGYCLYGYVHIDGSVFGERSERVDDIRDRWALAALSLEEFKEKVPFCEKPND